MNSTFMYFMTKSTVSAPLGSVSALLAFGRTSLVSIVLVILSSSYLLHSPTAAAQNTVATFEGIVDSTRNAGVKLERVDFDSLAGAEHTITVAWDSNADVRFRVFRANGSNLSPTVRDGNPGVWTGELDADTPYYMNIWSASGGAASYTATIETGGGTGTALAIASQPTDLSVTEGDDASFTVTATGSAQLTYQWREDGTDIPNATGSTLLLSAVALTDSGTSYSVVVTDETGSLLSDVATLTVNPDGPVTNVATFAGLVDSTKSAGPKTERIDFDSLAATEYTITVSWGSNADVRFRVFRANGSNISSTIRDDNPGVWTGELDADTPYFITVWSASGGAASYTATIETGGDAGTALAIASQPSDSTVTEGNNANFNVTATGSGQLTYQWRADGIDIPNATSSALSLNAVALTDTGNTYSVVVTDANGSITSDTATLTVEEVPVTVAITTQPTGLTVTEGDNAAFNVTANGSGQLTYQWLVGGNAIPNATGSTLMLSAVALTDTGNTYSVVVTDANGSTTSDTATLTVEEVPVTVAITTQPTGLTVTEGENATFTVAATGSGQLTYQWLAGGTAIPNAVGSTLMLNAVALTDTGTTYSVVVTDANGSVTSNIATLIVEEVPVTVAITTQPTGLTVTEGDNAIFDVAATGTGQVSYQWLMGGTAVPDATSSTLILNAVAVADAGTYSVIVTDINGSVTSNSATLTVDALPLEITSLPADLTVNEGDNASFSVTATGSGTLTYQWFADGLPITGATNSTLNLTAVLEDSGTVYMVQINDQNQSSAFASASLTVTDIMLPVTIVSIGQGAVDFDRNLGPRWVRHNFDSLADGEHTITVAWDNSAADIRFRVFETDNTPISPVIRDVNPGVWSGELDANTPYYIAVWSADGAANYTANIEANAPISITSQPSNLIVSEGENADFLVEATGSGVLSYQWLANGIPLPGETEDSLTIFATTVAEDGTEYTVEVSNEIDTVVSDIATLAVNAPLALGLFSEVADSSAWVLEGPAPTVDFNATATSDGWGQALLRVGDLLLVGGDFTGIKPTRSGPLTSRPFLAAFDAVTNQPVSTFQVPPQIDSVVRNFALSPDGNTVYVAGDFGLVALDAVTGQLEFEVNAIDGAIPGRVFDIAVTNTQLYVGGDFSNIGNTFRANIARLSLDGVVDPTWSPSVTNGFSSGRSAPVQSVTVSPSGDTVYVGGNFELLNGIDVEISTGGGRISMLAVSALDGTVQPERFIPFVGNVSKGLTAHDIVVTDSYVIIAWGGPNFVSFHATDGTRLQQYRATGDVQALHLAGDHVFVGHHGEFFGFLPNPIPQAALISLDPEIFEPFKLHSFRVDDPTFPPEQAWQLTGPFGVWDIAVSEDSIWVTGEISQAGSNERPVEGIAKFQALD